MKEIRGTYKQRSNFGGKIMDFSENGEPMWMRPSRLALI